MQETDEKQAKTVLGKAKRGDCATFKDAGPCVGSSESWDTIPISSSKFVAGLKMQLKNRHPLKTQRILIFKGLCSFEQEPASFLSYLPRPSSAPGPQ